jgi:hypothetical protein
VGVALVIAGILVGGAAAFVGWLSWMEPHSVGMHPADRGPVLAGALLSAGLLTWGVWILLSAAR